ncbi:unnamed protein product [Darwinula stevensoni]|uniref:Glyoxalase domain-containing protein n=1 Tax=Darwinula stevensoni TaxID=69355 RepID=A0A7R9FPU5_9CRUS|nr:unnamed protein product [Darwinula stevensoni]CAG0898109.1 unnamed protein product [Darwinula stevensoni]
MAGRRALHFVFKVGDRTKTAHFYRNILGMKVVLSLAVKDLLETVQQLQNFVFSSSVFPSFLQVLRHEEFDEGCKAACNGPYDGLWSKTMIGYGPEDDHFVVELTYNYGIKEYLMGNDFLGLTIQSHEAIENAKRENWHVTEENGINVVEAPGGYRFYLIDEPQPEKDPVKKLTLASSNLAETLNYWHGLLGLTIVEEKEKRATLAYAPSQMKLEFVDIGKPVDHAKAYGRIAFACPASELPDIEAKMKEKEQTILTPLVSLDTPGKATVQVVILADPMLQVMASPFDIFQSTVGGALMIDFSLDGHEICFVGDEGFQELSKVDPKGNELLSKAIAKDKSDDWFQKHRVQKTSA